MSRIYDNWERLIGAKLKREELRELAYAPSLSSISSDFSSRFSFSSPIDDHIPVNPEASSSPSSPFYSGESSDDSLPKPRSDDGKPNAMPILFKELKNATRNFRPDSILGEGSFGPIFKGRIN
ncbi:probable serine/threonine-protein kinase PBL3 [Olea europaea var. sylvestris]|uniref:probable serine/threonine-protein kinase PBL3 n=1 Tax=Olea europaea var. sylvestris TaxID=158386 RepID=UPI000C1D7054|nr:probable serine/threonine-protein kinase PBL3 [Olea europaea var. sylvestris]